MGAPEGSSLDHAQETRTIVCALNLLSRGLPLPPDVLHAVFSIYAPAAATSSGDSDDGSDLTDGTGDSSVGNLMLNLEEALVKQRANCMSSAKLREIKKVRLQGHIQHRLTELEALPSNRGEDLQTKCLLELYGLKLAELQSKVRSEVSSEYWIRANCAHPNKQLFDWGMMRLRRPLYGVGDAFAMEADDHLRKKRDAERLSRFEEEEKNRIETRKRKFFAEVLNAVREFQLQVQATLKRRKQRNDGVQSWHGRQRQRVTRAEKLRYQALKADDQEAYMKMVEESKNERLTMLLGKTNELLVCLGAAVQRQKDAETDGIEPLEESEADLRTLSGTRSGTPGEPPSEENVNTVDTDSDHEVKTGDLLEGQRQYNSVVHSIQEKVTEQPSMLQGGELRTYQLEGLQWMLSLFNNNLNGILADEMGLGKTIQTISLIAYLMENKGVTGPHLVVAPKAVLSNWYNEFSSWAPSISVVLYDGRLDDRKVMREELTGEGKFHVLITHYDLIMKDKAFLKRFHWYYMIVDEGHRLKNHECALAKTLVSGYRIRRRLLLTGTPIQNSLQELWSLLNFLLPQIFNSVQNFEEWFNAPFADRGDVSLNDEEELLVIRRLHHVIRPFILRRKKSEVEKFLPGKTQVILKCDMSAWQKVYYNQVTDFGRVGLGTGTKSKSLQNLSMQLRKCCNHPYLFVAEYNKCCKEEIIRASGKFELLDRLLPKLQRAGHRVLLFSQMTRLMDILQTYLQLHDFKFLRLDGSTKTEDRGELLKKFNAPNSEIFMFLLSTRAGGLGLNLQTADTVIIFDSDWNPQMDQQAEDRAHRIGQKKEVRVFVLVSVGSIEEVILDRAKQKMGIDAKVIQAGLFNTTSTAQDRRAMLEEIMRRGTNSLGTDVPSEREINRLAARSEEEFWLFEKMDEERRQKENYKSRLMEDHEVPDWAYSAACKEEKVTGFDHEVNNISGKRRRKEIFHADALSDSQWLKAMENGENVAKHSYRGKRREHLRSVRNEPYTCNAATEKKLPEKKHENDSIMASEGTSTDTYGAETTSMGFKPVDKPEYQGVNGSGLSEQILTWKTHKRKRSSFALNSVDVRGPNINGKGNGWS